MTVIVFYLTFIYPEPRSDLLVNKKDINLFYLICCTCKLISLAISTNLDIFLSISLFFILAVGPDILIAAIAFPFLSNIGEQYIKNGRVEGIISTNRCSEGGN